MNMLTLFGIAVILISVYIIWLRDFLLLKWPSRFSKWHTIEDTLWNGSRQILVSRFYWIGGFLLTAHDTLAANGFDWTPVVDQFKAWVPEQFRTIAFGLGMVLTGLLFEYLRNLSTAPVGAQPAADLPAIEAKARNQPIN